MSNKKIIVVFGATGAQGGGLARAILNDKASEFAVRAVTRDANSEKAKALAAAGAELVEADIDEPGSIAKALEGAYGAYFVTFFWAHFSPEREIAEVQEMARASKEAGLQHVIWSTLEDTRRYIPLSDDRMPTLMEKYKVPHLDSKGESDRFFTEADVPATFLLTSFYWENFIYFGMGPKRGEDGKLTLALPIGNEQLAGIASEDIGKCAYGVFKQGTELAGKTLGIAGEHLTGKQMAEKFSAALGKEVNFQHIPFEVYRNLGFPGADDLGNMFQFFHDFADVVVGHRNIEASKSFNPELQNLEEWLQENVQRIPLS